MLLNICFALGQSRKTVYLCHMRRATLFILLLLAATLHAQQQTFRGRVVDAETGEPLPYASIYVAEGKGTLTNGDGEFTIEMSTTENIKISYLGYKTVFITNPEPSMSIRMKALPRQLREVEVYAVNIKKVLKGVIKQLKGDFKETKDNTNLYFFRIVMGHPKGIPDLAEGFLVAKSTMNLREPLFINGQSRATDSRGIRRIRRTNIQRLFSLSARMKGTDFWTEAILPLRNYSTAKRLYETGCSSFKDEDGHRIYVLDMKYKGKIPKDKYAPPIFEGTLYVDSATFRLLRFDGNAASLVQRVNFDWRQAEVKLHIGYDYSENCAMVSRLSIMGGNKDMTYKCLLFNVDKADSKHYYGKRGQNLIKVLKDVEYDTSLWNKYNIVQRTKEEEEIVRRATQTDSIR